MFINNVLGWGELIAFMWLATQCMLPYCAFLLYTHIYQAALRCVSLPLRHTRHATLLLLCLSLALRRRRHATLLCHALAFRHMRHATLLLLCLSLAFRHMRHATLLLLCLSLALWHVRLGYATVPFPCTLAHASCYATVHFSCTFGTYMPRYCAFSLHFGSCLEI